MLSLQKQKLYPLEQEAINQLVSFSSIQCYTPQLIELLGFFDANITIISKYFEQFLVEIDRLDGVLILKLIASIISHISRRGFRKSLFHSKFKNLLEKVLQRLLYVVDDIIIFDPSLINSFYDQIITKITTIQAFKLCY